MGAAIYIYSAQPLKEARGGLEDDIEERFGDALEITGGGIGQRGWNVDIELSDVADPATIPSQLAAYLAEWGVPNDTYLHIYPMDWVEGQQPRYIAVYSR